jgi:hypothetical protein
MMISGSGSISAMTFDENASLNETEVNRGLITSMSLSITSTTKAVKIYAETIGKATMAEIGFKNIKIQHSSNGTSGWTDEVPCSDDTIQNAYRHSKNGEKVNVTGGYYYRVVLDHYAKETGWFFPSSESIGNTSNVVWVS